MSHFNNLPPFAPFNPNFVAHTEQLMRVSAQRIEESMRHFQEIQPTELDNPFFHNAQKAFESPFFQFEPPFFQNVNRGFEDHPRLNNSGTFPARQNYQTPSENRAIGAPSSLPAISQPLPLISRNVAIVAPKTEAVIPKATPFIRELEEPITLKKVTQPKPKIEPKRALSPPQNPPKNPSATSSTAQLPKASPLIKELEQAITSKKATPPKPKVAPKKPPKLPPRPPKLAQIPPQNPPENPPAAGAVQQSQASPRGFLSVDSQGLALSKPSTIKQTVDPLLEFEKEYQDFKLLVENRMKHPTPSYINFALKLLKERKCAYESFDLDRKLEQINRNNDISALRKLRIEYDEYLRVDASNKPTTESQNSTLNQTAKEEIIAHFRKQNYNYDNRVEDCSLLEAIKSNLTDKEKIKDFIPQIKNQRIELENDVYNHEYSYKQFCHELVKCILKSENISEDNPNYEYEFETIHLALNKPLGSHPSFFSQVIEVMQIAINGSQIRVPTRQIVLEPVYHARYNYNNNFNSLGYDRNRDRAYNYC